MLVTKDFIDWAKSPIIELSFMIVNVINLSMDEYYII